MFVLVAGCILGFVSAFALGLYLSKSTSGLFVLDHPNVRSLHGRSVPRTGGVSLLAGIFVGIAPSAAETAHASLRTAVAPLVGLLLLALVSFQDDRAGVAAKWRILTHLLAATGLLAAGLTLDRLELPGFAALFSGWPAVFFTVLFAVWMINLYNFMDGMDGFAGGMAVIGFAALAWLGRTDAAFVVVCLIVAAASAGFLVHNFPPAKIFLGDTGSTALGFLAAACILWGAEAGLFPFWVAILVFSPFIVDATATLLRRLLRGEKVWEAHRTHYYQRLVLLGWGHRRTVLAEYALMLACAGSAALAVHLSSVGQASLMIGWILVYGLSMLGVGWLERRHATVSVP